MKIGIITNLYPPYARGGAEHVVVRTVEALMDANQDVFVISSRPKQKGKIVEEDRSTSERVYRFFPRNVYYILDDFKHVWPVRLVWHVIDAFSAYSRKRVEMILDDEHPDAVITHNLKGIGLSIPRAIQSRGIRHVHVVHDLQLIYPSGLLLAGKEQIPFFVRLPYAVYQFICRIKIGRPDLVIFPSRYLRDMYLKHGFFKKSKVIVMPNPAPRFIALARNERPAGPLRLLFVGQLEPHKGIQFLLDEFEKLDVEARLIVAGEGTDSYRVNAAAERNKKITSLGYISVEQLINCFEVADALVVPSLCYENSPTVIYESLNAGVPVVASNIGGVGELVQDGVNGFLFEAGSPPDFVRALRMLYEKKEEFAQRQQEIQATVAPHALSKYTQRLIEEIESLGEKK